MPHRLSPAEVAELAELLEGAPVRSGLVDLVLQAAEERPGMTLNLQSPPHHAPARLDGGRTLDRT